MHNVLWLWLINVIDWSVKCIKVGLCLYYTFIRAICVHVPKLCPVPPKNLFCLYFCNLILYNLPPNNVKLLMKQTQKDNKEVKDRIFNRKHLLCTCIVYCVCALYTAIWVHVCTVGTYKSHSPVSMETTKIRKTKNKFGKCITLLKKSVGVKNTNGQKL